MKLLRYASFPFVPVYYAVTSLRNMLYDLGVKKSTSYNFPVICVGNLSVGGTGKTPMIEYLINLLKDDYQVATLSRGYKRKTKGFVLANEHSTAETLGDEPFQFFTKFENDIYVAVDAVRTNGIAQLRLLNKPAEIILLDDAFQHRKVNAGLNILLTTYTKPYFNDFVLPAGNLREPRSGAKRANIIIVTKCPDTLSDMEKSSFVKRIKPEEHQHVFFSTIDYSNTVFSEERQMPINSVSNFTLVTGIANPNPLVTFLQSKDLKFEHLNYSDHYNFSEKDIKDLEKRSLIITTEKDFMRLKQYELLKDKLFYLPIKVCIDNEQLVNKLIKDFLKN